MLAERNPDIESAYHQLQVISQDKEKRLEYETREKALRDYNQLIVEAEARGEAKGEIKKAFSIAQNMLKLNLPKEIIVESTGLSTGQIESLKQKTK